MKSNMKKRMIALMLCMVMLLSGSTSVLADDANAEMNTAETVQEVQAEPAALSEEPAQPETAGGPEATVAAPTETAGGEADAPQATETAPEAAVTADTPQTEAAETTPHQDAMELTQEMKDADGNIVCTVKAEIPEGTFQANTSEVTMEVTDVDEPIEKEIRELMKKKLQDGKELGHYFLYNVSFKVNGQTTEPGREINITFDKKDFRIEDVKKANVFYYNEANSPMGNTEAEIIEIIQKADKIEELQKAGESAGNIDDYDLSEISLKADGTADKIQTEGRRSTVYGCYIEKDKPEETGDTAETEDFVTSKETATFAEEEFSGFQITWEKTGWNFTQDVGCVSKDESGNNIWLTAQNMKISASNDSDRVLNISTISENGDNKDLYSITKDGKTYVFNGAYVVNKSDYQVPANAQKITKLNGRRQNSTNQTRYQTQNSTSYIALTDTRAVLFVYEMQGPTMSAKCYTENGEAIGGSQAIDLKEITETIPLSDKALSITNYTFQYVSVIKEDGAVTIQRLRKTGETEGLQYSVSMEGDDWKDVGTDEIRFIYRKTNGQYPTIETVDTAGMIDIGLYDYKKDEIISELKFNGQDSSRYNQWIGYWNAGYNGNNDSYAVQGIVDKSLYDADGKALTAEQSIDGIRGYPKTAVSGGSVATRLFNTNHTIATGLNHLFTKDSDGYYEYNSAEHYAYYKQTDNPQKNFVVYQETAKDEGFVPLLDIDEDSSDTRRYYYGMTVGFNFIQPENGQVNGNDMVFSFSGDDDVWVYVDGKLVLDIGGIHGAVGGSINFSNGTVSVDNVVAEQQSGLSGTLGKTTSLKEIFSLSGNTFEDYTEHRIEFIYLERGAGESNCHLKFNMPPIPKDSLQVTKEITNTDKEKYSNIDFSFKVYLQTEQNSEKYEMLPDGTEYQIWENNAYTGKTGKIENGIFKLKDGQTALFTGIARNLNYYAEEVDVSSDEFDKVEINGWNVSYVDENGNEVSSNDGVVDGDKNYIAQSDKKRVGGNSNIVFKNRCSTANKRELWVTKQMQTGQTADADETFSFKIKFQGKDGSWILYGKGEEYYKVDSQNTRSGPFEVSSDDGVITGIKPGESLVLTQIMSGTKFRVSEVGLDDTKYFTPSVTIENSGNYVCDDSEVENGIASGTIKLSKDAKVIVTNSKRVNTITIEKVDSSDVSKKLSGAKFKIEKQGRLSENSDV